MRTDEQKIRHCGRAIGADDGEGCALILTWLVCGCEKEVDGREGEYIVGENAPRNERVGEVQQVAR